MTDQQPQPSGPQTFTADVEAQYAADLRAKRDRTDADIAAEYIVRPTRERIARDRASAASTRLTWARHAMTDAAASVMNQAALVHEQTFPDSDISISVSVMSTLDLEGATLTVTMSDLVATATLTVPTAR